MQQSRLRRALGARSYPPSGACPLPLSTRSIQRSFVYVDISDYSKLPDGVQLTVVLALLQIADHVQSKVVGPAEAQLCIGDGYIFVWQDALAATRFAPNLASSIEARVAKTTIPEFHFRIGVHTGPVRWFWDPGRKDWNYVGSGINGGNRVLSAIGKDTDDVVFVSGAVRQEVQQSEQGAARLLVQAMHNRGRRADKHNKLWRVYELNHSAQPQF